MVENLFVGMVIAALLAPLYGFAYHRGKKHGLHIRTQEVLHMHGIHVIDEASWEATAIEKASRQSRVVQHYLYNQGYRQALMHVWEAVKPMTSEKTLSLLLGMFQHGYVTAVYAILDKVEELASASQKTTNRP